MRNVLAVLAAFFLIGSICAQDRGMIAGTVLDEHGHPVVKAKVHITEKGVFVVHQIIQFHETDADGRFRIAQVPWGTYIVIGGKEDAGYPDVKFAFYSNNSEPTVALTEASPTADVTLKLGPKAGVLELEPVTDSTTGKEIRTAAITLKREGNPELYIETSTTVGRVLVPSLVNILMEITAPGYKTWPSPSEANTKRRLLLKPEEIQKLQVALTPEDATVGDQQK